MAFWTLPGGSPRADESTTAAAVREVYEETGLKVTVDRVFMTLETISQPDAPYRRLEVIFDGSEHDYTAAPRQLEGGLAPAFVPIEQLEARTLDLRSAERYRLLLTRAPVPPGLTSGPCLG